MWHSLKSLYIIVQGPIVRRLISANPRLNFNLDFFFPLFKCFVGMVFLVLYRASNNHILDKRIRLNFLLKLSDLKSDFTLTLGYLNLALNNPAQDHPIAVYPSSENFKRVLHSLLVKRYRVSSPQKQNND